MVRLIHFVCLVWLFHSCVCVAVITEENSSETLESIDLIVTADAQQLDAFYDVGSESESEQETSAVVDDEEEEEKEETEVVDATPTTETSEATEASHIDEQQADASADADPTRLEPAVETTELEGDEEEKEEDEVVV